MMASELILALEDLIQHYGDLPVTTDKPDMQLGSIEVDIKGIRHGLSFNYVYNRPVFAIER